VRAAGQLDVAAKRVLDLVVATTLLVVLLPLLLLIMVAIKLDSPGPVFFRAERVGYRVSRLRMLKFRKMRSDAAGPALTSVDDARFTRVGRVLVFMKLDELPQLWNVVRGEMSLVGPRPEDAAFVAAQPEAYAEIVQVKPGVTGLCQLAFARESELLAAGDRIDYYVQQLLPQKAAIDQLYAQTRSVGLDVRILFWTFGAVFLRKEVAVNRTTGALTLRDVPARHQPELVDDRRRVHGR
jgi:lipopolysaccharide/colanic/teichoic acid biosynthesis glycosyltransferase